MTNKWENRIVGYGEEDADQLLANPQNFRLHPKYQQDALDGTLNEIGWIQEVIVNQTTGHIIDGHLRVTLAMRKNEKVPVKYVQLTEQEEKIALATIDPISALATQDQIQLDELLDDIISVEDQDLENFLNSLRGEEEEEDDDELSEAEARESLADRFLMPPFSVLDARRGDWAERKELWLKLGIKSELGRGNDDDKTAKGLTYAVSSQPPHVYEIKNAKEKELGRKLGWQEFAQMYPEHITMAGTSIFDPVLAEICYSWFAPKGGNIIDPFAGGSVRGIVAGFLGYNYTGVELRKEQVKANRAQGEHILGRTKIGQEIDHFNPTTSDPDALTPVQRHGDNYVKRDDLFAINGVRGGKVRSCHSIAKNAKRGLTTAGSRMSPQVNIVAAIGKHLDLKVSVHTPTGELSPEVKAAERKGARITQHKAGYNNVIIARAREDAEAENFTEIPFGMECTEAIAHTRKQVANLPDDVTRIVMPVGSAMSLSGILWGLKDIGRDDVAILGVTVGADPTERLDEHAPKGWRDTVTLKKAKEDYHDEAKTPYLHGLKLDPIYEGKAAQYVEPGDLFWIVGIRETAVPAPTQAEGQVQWINDDSRNMLSHVTPGSQDLLFMCPPYADLEVYSDDPQDLSTMDYSDFKTAYAEIIKKTSDTLKENAFAVAVVGEVRNKKGSYYGFVQDTIEAFKAAGLEYYNEAILLTNVGSLAIRVNRMFAASRKLGKTHQNALVFKKGNPELPEVEEIATALTDHFNDHRKLYEVANQVLVFQRAAPKKATDGDVIIEDLPELLGDLRSIKVKP